MKHISFLIFLFAATVANAQHCLLPASAWLNYNKVVQVQGSSTPLYLATSTTGKTGIIDTQGKLIVPATFNSFGKADGNFIIGEVAKGKYELINLVSGKRTTIPYTGVFMNMKENTIAISVKGKPALIDTAFQMLIAPGVYENLDDVSCNRIAVEKDGKYGYADLHGKLVIQPQFLYASTMESNVGIVSGGTSENTTYGAVDTAGNIILKTSFASVAIMNNLLRVQDNNDKYALFSLQGNPLTPFMYDNIYDVEGEEYMIASHNNIDVLLDPKGQPAFDSKWLSIAKMKGASDPAAKGYWIVTAFDAAGTERYGLIKTDGTVVLKPVYPFLAGLGSDHLFVSTESADLFGVINYRGEQVLPFEYEECLQQRGENFVVRKNGKIGVVDKTGKVIIPFVYDMLKDDAEPCIIALGLSTRTDHFDLNGKKRP